MSDKVSVAWGDQKYELPVVSGSEKKMELISQSLRKGFNYVNTVFRNTGSCKSAITFLDGEKGILRYRAILEDLSVGLLSEVALYKGDL